jgi:hypothetical protein
MAVFVALAVLIVSQNAWAQGCIVSRISMPVVGPGGGESHVLPENESWLSCHRFQVSTAYRTFHSFRHFVGTEEQVNREIARTQVNNEVHAFDLSAAYTINRRWTVALNVPLLYARRYGQSTPENQTHGRGVGDISFGAQMWLIEPPAEGNHNIAFGFGIKLPTGNPGQTDESRSSNGTVRTVVVDQSIQPGDGGTGFNLSLLGYQGVKFVTLYGSGLYVFNPRNTNGVLTGRSRASEAIMSVPDQYQVRAGAVTTMPGFRMLALSMGMRLEGVPVRDAFGKSFGFRRPGYTLSVDPGFMIRHGRDEMSVNVPVAVRRNRARSVTDIMDGRSGDAAFADHQIVMGYSHHF